MPSQLPTPRDTFVRRFGDLVALLRVDPGNDAAQDLALSAAAGAVARASVVVEAGVDRGEPGEDLTLQGRMRARLVDVLRVAAGAEPQELLALARALSHDIAPVPSTGPVAVELAPVVVPGTLVDAPPSYSPARADGDRRREAERRHWTGRRFAGPERRRIGDRRSTGERRLRLIKHQQTDIAGISARLAQAVSDQHWRAVLGHAHALRAYAARVPASERRSFVITARRQLSRAALAGVVKHALQVPADRIPAVEVLRWAGLDGADAMLEAVQRSEVAGPRRFLHDALGGMPEAYPAIVPLLSSRRWHEVHHAAGILGRMGRAEAVPLLRPLLDHADPRVRSAAVHALAGFPPADAADALRAALAHRTPATRAAAADAIGARKLAVFAMPLMAALETERDREAWRTTVGALGALATPEACAALAAVALARRTLVTRRGYGREQRVEAVRALGRATGPHATAALQRVAEAGDNSVRRAALAALTARAAPRSSERARRDCG
ncbi:MAG TPA: HEAT repeat domain-containing protein [Gemmatimonadales bacterium]|nr:HEAT repeat domain-containing protein [Gemmatimonadales bacterium]